MTFINNVSIRARLYFSFVFFILAILIIYGILFVIVMQQNEQYRSYMQLSDATRQMQVDFKIQVQEWKNTLLRGYDKKNYDKYRGQFFEKSEEVQNELQILSESIPEDSKLASMIIELQETHKTLELQYAEALSLYDAGGDLNSSKIVDKKVKGIDRAPTESFDTIVETVNIEIDQKMEQNLPIYNYCS